MVDMRDRIAYKKKIRPHNFRNQASRVAVVSFFFLIEMFHEKVNNPPVLHNTCPVPVIANVHGFSSPSPIFLAMIETSDYDIKNLIKVSSVVLKTSNP